MQMQPPAGVAQDLVRKALGFRVVLQRRRASVVSEYIQAIGGADFGEFETGGCHR